MLMPGGSALASDTMWHEVVATRARGLPVVVLLTYAHVCSRMLTRAHLVVVLLTYAHVCSRMLTYADGC
jgi:hypothetical protein